MATVKLFGNLRKHMDGSQLQISGGTVRAVLDLLCESHPSLYDAMLENGDLRPYFKIMLNGHDISLAKGLDTTVREDDQIAIFPPIAGG